MICVGLSWLTQRGYRILMHLFIYTFATWYQLPYRSQEQKAVQKLSQTVTTQRQLSLNWLACVLHQHCVRVWFFWYSCGSFWQEPGGKNLAAPHRVSTAHRNTDVAGRYMGREQEGAANSFQTPTAKRFSSKTMHSIAHSSGDRSRNNMLFYLDVSRNVMLCLARRFF